MDRVWINGCFDIIHRGHIELINYASEFGIVKAGLDTDERVKKSKGNDRPFNTISAFILNYYKTENIDDSIKFANKVSSIVVNKRGVATI